MGDETWQLAESESILKHLLTAVCGLDLDFAGHREEPTYRRSRHDLDTRSNHSA